ncbi:Vacuolar protein sorting-associated protein 20 [Blastocladiella emersonii ATCC 22665]|nr:Vacuolar protein sorting-associated protein 20 [Blastocladiella emersonii ATCC 22665]
MGQVLSSSGKPKALPHDKAVFELKRQRDNLRKYQAQLSRIVDRETAIARKCLAAGDKRRALLALRKKKYQEQLLEKSDKQLCNLEEMAASIEYAALEAQILTGLEQGNAALAELNKETSLDRVDKIMEETAEAMEYQREIEEMLGTKLSEEDEAAVLAELAAIETEQALDLEHAMPAVPVTPLPEAVATTEPEQPQVEATTAAAQKPAKVAAGRQKNEAMPA